VAKLRAKLIEGVAINVDFDFAANLAAPDQLGTAEYLLLDLDAPAGAAKERLIAVLNRCDKLLRGIEGVQDVLALSEHPFDLCGPRPCILVRLAPVGGRKANREELIRTIRGQLEEVKDSGVSVRLRDLSGRRRFPRCAYPVDLALSGPQQAELQQWAQKLLERLRQTAKLTDLWLDPDGTPQTQISVDIDREKCGSQGIDLRDVAAVVQNNLANYYVNDFSPSGRSVQVIVQSEATNLKLELLKQTNIRNAKGELIALSSIATIREIQAARTVNRLDGQPMVEITANPAAGVSLGVSRSLCEKLAEETRQELKLPVEYRLSWLQVMPPREQP
jgi:multidrug efflux pump subunit AcrB